MTARIEEGVDRAGAIASQQHRLLAHARLEEVTGLGDLALVTDEEPGPAEQVLEFVAVRSSLT